jgi:hypothetical protein
LIPEVWDPIFGAVTRAVTLGTFFDAAGGALVNNFRLFDRTSRAAASAESNYRRLAAKDVRHYSEPDERTARWLGKVLWREIHDGRNE